MIGSCPSQRWTRSRGDVDGFTPGTNDGESCVKVYVYMCAGVYGQGAGVRVCVYVCIHTRVHRQTVRLDIHRCACMCALYV